MKGLVDHIFRGTKFNLTEIFGFVVISIGVIVLNFETFYVLFKQKDKQLEEEENLIEEK